LENIESKKNGRRPWILPLIALIIMIFLMVVSAILLAIRLVNYIKIDDGEVLLQSGLDTELDIFSVEYKNATGEITVEGMDGQKVVAPGTSVDYTIHLRNKDKVALDYELIPSAAYTSEHTVPVLVRMLDDDGNYIIGDAKTWVAIHDIGEVSDAATLVKGESTEYVFQWKWEFETGDDAYDTSLGNLPTDANVGVSVKMELHATANTDIGTNGGVWRSGLGEILFAGLVFILLLIAIILILLKKKRDNPGKEPLLTGVEGLENHEECPTDGVESSTPDNEDTSVE